MSDMPRFTIIDGQEYPDPDGHWVFVNDANAAVAAAEQTLNARWEAAVAVIDGRNAEVYALGVKAARDAVLRLNKPWARAYMDTEVLAAIDGVVKP